MMTNIFTGLGPCPKPKPKQSACRLQANPTAVSRNRHQAVLREIIMAENEGRPISALQLAERVGVDYPHLHICILRDLSAAKMIRFSRPGGGRPMRFVLGRYQQGVMDELLRCAVAVY